MGGRLGLLPTIHEPEDSVNREANLQWRISNVDELFVRLVNTVGEWIWKHLKGLRRGMGKVNWACSAAWTMFWTYIAKPLWFRLVVLTHMKWHRTKTQYRIEALRPKYPFCSKTRQIWFERESCCCTTSAIAWRNPSGTPSVLCWPLLGCKKELTSLFTSGFSTSTWLKPESGARKIIVLTGKCIRIVVLRPLREAYLGQKIEPKPLWEQHGFRIQAGVGGGVYLTSVTLCTSYIVNCPILWFVDSVLAFRHNYVFFRTRCRHTSSHNIILKVVPG